MGIAPDASGAHLGAAAAEDIRGHHHQPAGRGTSTTQPARDEPRRTIVACAGVTDSSSGYVAAAHALLFALRAYLFSQKQEPRPTLNDEQGGLRFGGVAPLVVLGTCPFLVHYRHDDPNGRYHSYLAAHAPAGAISWPPTLCF